MDRGAWQATVRGVTESDLTEWLRLSLSRYKLFGWHITFLFSPHLVFSALRIILDDILIDDKKDVFLFCILWTKRFLSTTGLMQS